MKNVLILTGRFGMGHYAVAEAVRQDIQASTHEVHVETVDIVTFLMPVLGKGIYAGFHLLVSRWANVYNALNQVAGRYSAAPFRGKFNRKLSHLMKTYEPDCIISTLPMSSKYISVYKKTKGSEIPLYTYITDISTHDEWICEGTNLYLVGSESVREGLLLKGVAPNKIRVTGIPVKAEFKKETLKAVSSSEGKEVLIMGGGFGLIPFAEGLFQELNQLQDVKTTVITGGNEKLYERLKESYSNLNIVGYTNHVDEYMGRADMVISKAGGITMFEAIYTQTPICVIQPFLAQEIGNAKYIEKEGLGKVVWKENEGTVSQVLELLSDERELVRMKNRMVRLRGELEREASV